MTNKHHLTIADFVKKQQQQSCTHANPLSYVYPALVYEFFSLAFAALMAMHNDPAPTAISVSHFDNVKRSISSLRVECMSLFAEAMVPLRQRQVVKDERLYI